jgi:hypothetical protein
MLRSGQVITGTGRVREGASTEDVLDGAVLAEIRNPVLQAATNNATERAAECREQLKTNSGVRLCRACATGLAPPGQMCFLKAVEWTLPCIMMHHRARDFLMGSIRHAISGHL